MYTRTLRKAARRGAMDAPVSAEFCTQKQPADDGKDYGKDDGRTHGYSAWPRRQSRPPGCPCSGEHGYRGERD